MSEHFRYDVENIVPDNIPELPVGTLAELQAEKMDPATVPCCHKRVMNGDEVVVKGCPFRASCKLAIRDEAGPQFFGIEILKGRSQGGKMVRGVRDCFWVAKMKDQIEHPDNGGSVRIVATEGETFKMTVISPETNYQPRNLDIEVPRFTRPGQNPDLAMEQLKALTRHEEQLAVTDRQLKKNLGKATKP